MPLTKDRVQYPDLKGSEQHHDLKNRPGEKGDPDHAKDDGEVVAGKTSDGASDA